MRLYVGGVSADWPNKFVGDSHALMSLLRESANKLPPIL